MSLNAQLLSQRFRSTPNVPMNRAVLWIEATLRNGDAEHLRTNSLHLNFWQIYAIDICFAVFLINFGFMFIVVYHCCLRRSKKVEPEPDNSLEDVTERLKND